MEFRTLFIGGILPALFLGVSTVLMKLSLKNGITLPMFLFVVGTTVGLTGLGLTLATGEKSITIPSGLYAIAMAVAWAGAILGMSYGMSTLKMPVSVMAPITNSNALVTVILSAFIFSEWKDLNLVKLGIGTALLIAGATFVSTATNN